MTNPPRQDRVQVWASQLAANDFPPVCAMTGRPAETWRKFRFVTLPGWAYALLVLVCTGIGLLPIFIIMRVVSRTASGHMPLTRASSDQIRNANLVFGGVLALTPVLWIASIVAGASSNDPNGSAAVGVLFILGLLVLVAGAVLWTFVRPMFGPKGKVMAKLPGHNDNIVELTNLHPTFVAEVQHHQHARFAQAYAPQAPLQPESK